ncbi:hypothetical protein BDB00DRAFT_878649 [Zychaea mexicana]|uniref:uncharacterized protein n=1 Tax=Zychaea mexicana TaxID=64656 RepID=UPI0022FF31F3|nr:uncharacterized protein BDB00DRAFT_878649 [Zychaea mexicana]KAI9484580.1 hypothetical protein BDB00DRAFT_878649 [Zychaea mexicana]
MSKISQRQRTLREINKLIQKSMQRQLLCNDESELLQEEEDCDELLDIYVGISSHRYLNPRGHVPKLQDESRERLLEQAAPSPEPQNEEVNSIASSRVESGSDNDDDDDDNVPRGRNFTAVYSVNEAKRRKLESKNLKLEHERLQLEKARLAEQKRASQAQEQQTYASDRTKFFIELLKLGKTTDEAKQIIENVYE